MLHPLSIVAASTIFALATTSHIVVCVASQQDDDGDAHDSVISAFLSHWRANAAVHESAVTTPTPQKWYNIWSKSKSEKEKFSPSNDTRTATSPTPATFPALPVTQSANGADAPGAGNDNDFSGLNPDVGKLNCDPIPLFRSCTDNCVSNVDAHETMDGFALGEWAHNALKACFNKCRVDYIEVATPGCIGGNGVIVPPGSDDTMKPTGGAPLVSGHIERAKWWWSWWYYHHRHTVWTSLLLLTVVISSVICCIFAVLPRLQRGDAHGYKEALASRAMKTASYLASLEWTPREIREQLPWGDRYESIVPHSSQQEATANEALLNKRWVTTTAESDTMSRGGHEGGGGGTEMIEYTPIRSNNGIVTDAKTEK